MIHEVVRRGRRLSKSSLVLVFCLFAIGSEEAICQKSQAYEDSLRVMPATEQWKPSDYLKSARYHAELGRAYHILATVSAVTVGGQAKCYLIADNDKSVPWGAEYFAALSSAFLKDYPAADSLSKRMKSGSPKVLTSLAKILGNASHTPGADSASLQSLRRITCTSLPDSIEVVTQLYLRGESQAGKSLPSLSRLKTAIPAGAAFLAGRNELLRLIANGEGESLRKYLVDQNYLQALVCSVRVSSVPDPALFLDPVVVKLVADAHLLLADRDFQRSQPNLTADTLTLKLWLKTCRLMDAWNRADSLILASKDPHRSLPFQPWIESRKGKHNLAVAQLAECRKIFENNYGRDYMALLDAIAVSAGVSEIAAEVELQAKWVSDWIFHQGRKRELLNKGNEGRRLAREVHTALFYVEWAKGNFVEAANQQFYWNQWGSGEISFDGGIGLIKIVSYAGAMGCARDFPAKETARRYLGEMSKALPLMRFIVMSVGREIDCTARMNY